ncbi:MAG TPA: M28 family peptidase, partial [Pyrinomonadaceae bacterium]|nr:M28 family peptidase [Pyrinomonadaceae bacterium]
MSSALKTSPFLTIRHCVSSAGVAGAFRFFERNADAITEEQIRICSVPASPFGERERAEYLSKKFTSLGLTEVEIDEEGNCLGLIEGVSRSPLIVVSAHLDTVFSTDTDLTVVKREHRLLAPGIADDGCGLAALIALA